MSDERDIDDLLEATAADSGRDSVTPEQHRRLKAAVFGEAFGALAASDVSYFVIGSYGEEEKRRLLLVRDGLRSRGDGTFAFLMDEFPEAWEFWTTKFKILATRADVIVGVFEHSHGGHEWEAGYVDHDRFRAKSHVLKREYESEAQEREAFDAMFAHFLAVLDELGRLYPWATEDELRERVVEIP